MKRTKEISNADNLIDTRDVIARIEELQAEKDALEGEVEEKLGDFNAAEPDESTEDETEARRSALETAKHDLKEWVDDAGPELAALTTLADEAEDYAADWKHGETLIRDSYFEKYAQELAEDIGAIDRNASWPLGCIDWEKAAEELQIDYTSVDYDGVTYWIR